MAGGDITIADEHWRVIVAPTYGFLIRDAVDVVTGAQTLWSQEPVAPPPLSRSLPPPGPGSLDTFWDVFAGGWFPMFPTAGFTGELDGQETLFHGELNRLPWEVVDSGPSWVEARVETVRVPFEVMRRVELVGGELRVRTHAVNVGAATIAFTHGEHPCFPLDTFAGGGIELEALDAWIPDPSFDLERAKLTPGKSFAWPMAPSGGGELDVSTLPEQGDDRHDHICVTLADPVVRLPAPRFGRTLELEFDLATMPFVLMWQDLGERGAFSVEPCTAPDRGIREAISAGAIRRLGPGESFETSVILRWEPGSPA